MSELVSVVIPTYNDALLLTRSIDSALMQTYKNIEIIVVDDGSEDETPALLTHYAGDIRSMRVEHGGLSHARNTGIAAARGSWICLLDADDYLEKNAISILVTAAIATSADLALGGHYAEVAGRSSKRILAGELVEGSESLHVFFLGRGRGHTFAWGKLYRASLLKQLLYPVGKLFEDIRVITRICELTERMVVVPVPLYHYCLRPGSITYSQNVDSLMEILEARLEILDYYRKYQPKLLDQARALVAECGLFLMGRIWRAGISQNPACWKRACASYASHRRQLSRLETVYRFAEVIFVFSPKTVGALSSLYSLLRNRV